MVTLSKITPCLWFDDRAEAAVAHYTAIFPDARIVEISRYPESDHPAHAGRAGQVMTIVFVLAGQRFAALNGGPEFNFTEAVSFQVDCETQEEIDYYWERLSDGGDPAAQQCGWLKDRFGLSWQIVPSMIGELMGGDDPDASRRAMQALLQMRKIDIEALRGAREG